MTHWSTFQTIALLVLNELASQGTAADMAEVSVCQDATFQVPTSRGVVCSGTGARPLGVECPRVGDTALDECYPYLDSYNGVDCIAKEDAQCVHLDGRNAWGCTFPSTFCLDYWKSTLEEIVASGSCPTWNYSRHEGFSSSSVNLFDGVDQDACDPAWFAKTTVLTDLYKCKVDTPTSAPAQVQETAIPTTASEIPVYTAARTSTGATDALQVEVVLPTILEEPPRAPEAVAKSPTPLEIPVQTEQATAPPVVQETSLPIEVPSPVQTEEISVLTTLPETQVSPELTPTETLTVSIPPTPTPAAVEQSPTPSEAQTSSPVIETPAIPHLIAEVASTYAPNETLIPNILAPAQTWITPTTTTTSATTAPPVLATTAPTIGSKPSYPTPGAKTDAPTVPEATEPASTTATPIATILVTEVPRVTENATPISYTETHSTTETLAPTSTSPAETMLPDYSAEPEFHTPESTSYQYNSDTPTSAKTETSRPIAAISPTPSEDVETDAPTLSPTVSGGYSDSSDSIDVDAVEPPSATPCTNTEPPVYMTNAPTFTPTVIPAQTLVSTEESVYTTQPITTEIPTTETPCTNEPTTEVPTIETQESEALTTETPMNESPMTETSKTNTPCTDEPTTDVPTIDTSQSEALTTEMPLTEAPSTQTTTETAMTETLTTPVATIQSQYQQDGPPNYQQSQETSAPPAITQTPTQATMASPVSTTSSAVQSTATPCATVTSNKQSALQVSTEADLTTIASVSISAAAVVAIILAISSIVVVTIAVFRVRGRCNQPLLTKPEDLHLSDHSIVLTPSDF